jgi:hypothetical protein
MTHRRGGHNARPTEEEDIVHDPQERKTWCTTHRGERYSARSAREEDSARPTGEEDIVHDRRRGRHSAQPAGEEDIVHDTQERKT